MPAVQDLRRAIPGVTVDWVVERAFAPLVSRCQGVRRVIPCDLRRWRKAPFSAQTRQAWQTFKAELQQEQYDAVIDLQGLTKSALVSWLARLAPRGKRYGLANRTEGSGFEAPARWVAHRAIRLEPHVHAVDRSRQLCAAALGYAVDGPPVCGLVPGGSAVLPPVPLPALATLSVNKHNAFAPRMPTVALVHGTSRADKEWPLASWIEVGQRLNHAGFTVALAHGSAAERKTSETIAAQLEHTWMWPIMPLDALVDTMAHCAGVIGVDSGLSHVAVALDLAHVQIYNFDTAWRTGPQSGRQLSVFADPHPDVQAVWTAWESLGTPVLCR